MGDAMDDAMDDAMTDAIADALPDVVADATPDVVVDAAPPCAVSTDFATDLGGWTAILPDPGADDFSKSHAEVSPPGSLFIANRGDVRSPCAVDFAEGKVKVSTAFRFVSGSYDIDFNQLYVRAGTDPGPKANQVWSPTGIYCYAQRYGASFTAGIGVSKQLDGDTAPPLTDVVQNPPGFTVAYVGDDSDEIELVATDDGDTIECTFTNKRTAATAFAKGRSSYRGPSGNHHVMITNREFQPGYLSPRSRFDHVLVERTP
jgi:hypothetical protein